MVSYSMISRQWLVRVFLILCSQRPPARLERAAANLELASYSKQALRQQEEATSEELKRSEQDERRVLGTHHDSRGARGESLSAPGLLRTSQAAAARPPGGRAAAHRAVVGRANKQLS